MIQTSDQLYINNKWYMDVLSMDETNMTVRIKYYEGANKSYYLYKEIKLPISLFTDLSQKEFIIFAKVDESELRDIIGNLINRIVKEQDITKLLEDANISNTSGMGNVVSAGMSGIPGVTGSSGSGDISSILPKNEYGLEIDPKINKKSRKKLLSKPKSQKRALIDSNVIDLSNYLIKYVVLDTLLKEDVLEETDNDYKLKLYQFLDYPTDNDMDIKFIESIEKNRAEFLSMSKSRIVQYLNDLYKTNKTIIDKKCSEWFQNNIQILAEI